ncbi:hypothetical protein ACF07B_07905 [Streptomyces sp. NPDC015532]|uniref:hypothetical protein n=1 Tax=Streptomyces sp. NPDC015532 TaxID=3364960 RepID=UPI0036F55E38
MDDGVLGCLGLIGIAVAAAVCWLLYEAVLWVVAEWRWAWFVGCAVAVPCAAYLLVRVWGEQWPFDPMDHVEVWVTAVATALAVSTSFVVLVEGWPTAVVALLVAAGSAAGVAYLPWWPELVGGPAVFARNAASSTGIQGAGAKERKGRTAARENGARL